MNPWGALDRLSGAEIRRLQSAKLHIFVNTYLYPFSPYYRELFDQNNIDPKSIRAVEDLQKIPLTAKSDFIATMADKDKFRKFVLQPDASTIRQFWPLSKQLPMLFTKISRGEDYLKDQLSKEFRPVFITFTTGTTNTPVPFTYTNYDINNLHTTGARMLNLFNIDSTHNIVNMFPYAPHLAFWQVVFGGLASNALILSTGGGKVMGTEGNISAILKVKPSVILGVPSYVYHVLRLAKEKGCRMDFVQKVVLGAARITEPFKIKVAGLLEAMGAKDVCVFGTYGFTEARSAWAECPTSNDTSSGYHLYPDLEIFEVVDPKTGAPKKEGEDGELVYTGLNARGSAVLRYRTGDFVRGGITTAPCPHCKRTVPRISSDITRISDIRDLKLSKIKGSLVDLNHCTAVLSEFREIDEWQIEIRKKNNDPYEIDELVICLSVNGGCDQNALVEAVKKKILLVTEVTPNEVVILPQEEMLKRLELETASKEKRIIDCRPQ